MGVYGGRYVIYMCASQLSVIGTKEENLLMDNRILQELCGISPYGKEWHPSLTIKERSRKFYLQFYDKFKSSLEISCTTVTSVIKVDLKLLKTCVFVFL